MTFRLSDLGILPDKKKFVERGEIGGDSRCAIDEHHCEWCGCSEGELHKSDCRILEENLKRVGANNLIDDLSQTPLEVDVEALAELIDKGCPNCGNQGWFAQQVSDTEQEKRQCDCSYHFSRELATHLPKMIRRVK